MSRRGLLALAVAIAVAGLPRPAAAHPLDIGYLRIVASDAAVEVTLDVHVNTAARLTGVDPGALTASDIARHAAALADATVRGAPITTEHGACRWTTATASLRERTASITTHAACPGSIHTLRWALPFITDARVASTFQVLVKAQLAGADHVGIVDRVRPAIALDRAPSIGFARFVWTGVEHIGAAPAEWHDPSGWKLPDGIDHILFLLGLMLAGGTLARILGIVSGFTLGHSITLALSALHVVRPPAAIIEPLIALSIAFVAAEALVGRFESHRWKIATAFGLIHGFGFASALNELQLSTGDLISALFGYNLGVELGQVAIVLVAAPFVLALHRHRQLRWIVRGLAAVIFLAGMAWFVERL